MPLISIPQLFTNQFQVTCNIKQVFRIRVKFMKYTLFTHPQLQICNIFTKRRLKKTHIPEKKTQFSKTSIKPIITFKNNHNNPLHFLCICLVYQSSKYCSFLTPDHKIIKDNK